MTTENANPNETIEAYFAAMRRGADAESELLALFHPDAVYDEPFTGQPPAVGLQAIRERFRAGWEFPLPQLELDVLNVEVDPSRARSAWECRSPALARPVRGQDNYEFRDGLITRLEVRLDEPDEEPD